MLRNVSARELKDLMDVGEKITVVNVLEKGEFDREHICGSMSIPLSDIEKDVPNLLKNKDDTIVVHCSGAMCTASAIAREKLTDLGYRDVRRFEGGIDEWRKAGYCLEGTAYKKVAA